MLLRTTIATLSLFVFVGFAPAQSKEEEVARHIEDLKSKDAKTRASAAEQIGKLVQLKASLGKPALKPLLDAIKDTETEVRRNVVMALAKLDNPTEVVPVLTTVLKDDKVLPVRVAAATGLGIMGSASKDAVPTLRDVAKDARESKDKADMRLAQACQQAIQQIEERGKKK